MRMRTRSRSRERKSCDNKMELAESKMEEHDVDHDGSFRNLDKRDKQSVMLLMFLYVLQGIPLGLAGSVPFVLSERHASYSAQGTFSFSTWPFSVKIIWAPIVDAIYSSRFGRRKCWMVPAQYGIGFCMLVMSYFVNSWMGLENGQLQIYHVTIGFILLNFLAATQDVAVDGWALTMLSRKNVGWASTCNSVGQTAGYFIAYILFLALESPKFSNTWLRSTPSKEGIITMGGFLFFWGLVFIITTTFVMIFKSEETDEDDDNLSVKETYGVLWRIIKLKPIQQYIITIFMIKFGFAAADAVTGLKLIERGVAKESLAFIGVLIVPLQIFLPFAVSRYTAGPRPLDTMYSAVFPRLLIGLSFAPIVYITPWFRKDDGEFPLYYFGLILLSFILHQIAAHTFFVCQMGFHAKISDPKVGGTYMTLLNTFTNLAGNIPATAALYFVDPLTFMHCKGGSFHGKRCYPQKGCGLMSKCVGYLDGYYVESGIFFAVGVIAMLWRKRTARSLQNLSSKAWRVTS